MNHPTRLAFSVGIVLLILGALFAATASASPEDEPARSSPRVSAIAPPPPPISYTLTINKNGNGSVTPPSGTQYLSGTNATLNATADPGWQFSGWTGAITGSTNPVTIKMITDTTVTANFTSLPTYTLTINIVGTGTVTKNPDQPNYTSGSSVQLTANPASGWQFSGWTGNLSGSTNPSNISMTANRVVTATFVQLFTLTVSVSGSGSVTKNPNQAQYTSGSSVQLTANPASGWQFTGWSGDLGGTANPGSIVMNANKVVMANFSAIPPSQPSAAPTSTSQPTATATVTGTPIPLATITPLLGAGAATATATSTPTTRSTLPTTGGSPLTWIAVGLVLVLVVVGARVMRQSST